MAAPSRALRPTLALGLVLTLAACGDASGSPGTPPASPVPVVPVATPTPGDDPTALVIDWSASRDTVDLGDGWSATACDGQAPLVCVARDGEVVGTVERIGFPVADPPDGDDDVPAWLAERADRFAASLAADRAVGCGDGYTVAFDAHTEVVLGGMPALRYRFTGTGADGTVRERGVAVITVTGHVETVLAANAYGPGGCVDADGSPWSVDHLADATAPLDALAAVTAPVGPGQVHGMVFGRVVARDGNVLTVDTVEMLSGAEAVRAAHEDGELSLQEDDLPNDVYVRDRRADQLVLTVGPDVTVDLVDCTAECRPTPVDTGAWLDGTASAFNGEGAVYVFSLGAGSLVHVAEQYLP